MGLAWSLFWWSGMQLRELPRDEQLQLLRVRLPLPVQLMYATGDRYLAADLNVFRSLMVDARITEGETYRVQGQLQVDAAFFNPHHEDNYYLGAAILPWNGELAAAQGVLLSAAQSRDWDMWPAFFYAFNAMYFERDMAKAGHWAEVAAERDPINAVALRAMAGHRLRTLLTMLGIVIGIASVVSVVALGQGSRERILKDISAMGTNTIDIFPGRNFGDRRAATIRTLVPADAQALARLSYVDSVSPNVSTSVTSRRGNIEATATVSGVSESFFRVKGYTLADGQGFDASSVARLGQEAVIDPNTRRALFSPGEEAVGQVIFLGSVPVRVIGVTAPLESAMGSSDALNIWVPYTTAMKRMLGQDHLRNITVRISDQVPSAAAEQGIVALLTQRHGVQDFFTRNSDSIRQTIDNATQTMTLLVSAIALISLVVGGIGVMNIMLVSVTERTQEIGVRMAVGARQSDILRQFLIEAVLVCLIGGVLGIGIALLIGEVFDRLGGNFSMVYSTASIVAAFGVSTLIGVVFGFLPARNAARLDPVVALARQ